MAAQMHTLITLGQLELQMDSKDQTVEHKCDWREKRTKGRGCKGIETCCHDQADRRAEEGEKKVFWLFKIDTIRWLNDEWLEMIKIWKYKITLFTFPSSIERGEHSQAITITLYYSIQILCLFYGSDSSLSSEPCWDDTELDFTSYLWWDRVSDWMINLFDLV